MFTARSTNIFDNILFWTIFDHLGLAELSDLSGEDRDVMICLRRLDRGRLANSNFEATDRKRRDPGAAVARVRDLHQTPPPSTARASGSTKMKFGTIQNGSK